MFSGENIPEAWRDALERELENDFPAALSAAVAAERERGEVYPPPGQCFAALRLTPPENVQCVILGQDPYHEPGQAHGLAFSVPCGVRLPPSLRNILRELHDDLGCDMPSGGDLSRWGERGVLLLNTTMTVRRGAANSHRDLGWEKFTGALLRILNATGRRKVFILWGNYAQSKDALLDHARHRVIRGVHPSPLSAYRGFAGSRPFSQCNAMLRELGEEEINWRL